MESRLQQVLRSLCFNTGWNYAVLWKLKHRQRLTLTWEDAFFNGNQFTEKKLVNETAGSLNKEGAYSDDSLGVALAKMSYQVYSVGEGIIGQAAISGKHYWIFSDQYAADSSTLYEYTRGWSSQFSAGIKTIAVVAVIPHGVVQLGSECKLAKDLKLVDHIRNVFSELQDPFAGLAHSSVKSIQKESCLPGTCTTVADTVLHDCGDKLTRFCDGDDADLWTWLSASPAEPSNCSRVLSPVECGLNRTTEMKIQHKGSSSSDYVLKRHPQVQLESCTTRQNLGETDFKVGKRLELMTASGILDSPAFQDQGDINIPDFSSTQLQKEFESKKLMMEPDWAEMQIPPFSFSAGYELYEALGPSFQKQNNIVFKADKNDLYVSTEVFEDMGSCSLLIETPDIHLLDAVVTKVGKKGDETGSDKSCHEAWESISTSERTLHSSMGSVGSVGYSLDRDTPSSLKSATGVVEALKGFSSGSSSRGSDHSPGSVKINKKRARPGESCRPRPRDRQLIQDRVKELRELVPDGSKCSIDSLFERAIKHVLFMQSVTKHAEKLKKCSVSKLLDKDTGIQRFSCREQGSTWAVEVGNHHKVCPIIVENATMDGIMLIEMLCSECSHFLLIAETIKGLGLNILRGTSEVCGNKMRICFLVEAQNNVGIQRVDVMWSLMQLLQPKTFT